MATSLAAPPGTASLFVAQGSGAVFDRYGTGPSAHRFRTRDVAGSLSWLRAIRRRHVCQPGSQRLAPVDVRRRPDISGADAGDRWLEHRAGGAITMGRGHPQRVAARTDRLSDATEAGPRCVFLRTNGDTYGHDGAG